ncbi:hypothetical protein RHAB21_01444 [Pseudorhizobium halotolerans]|uniref:Uncharacterized protein n=1 Tax=Pseudorhizobium halotolerans TaxID=1233081 RepID=A0ABM8PGA3_9HYPH|nr:hypothetical protein RFYW14_01338 [Pseudorhizobium flavum]CAD6604258.1 hypothetical protein RNT25_01553 [arsenite-oxidising bacterium NT-25]CAD6608762.1 hypothetical protein RKHAN_02146 [Rhizobium sp. Khangiran2]CAD7027930.1 hypothetical protein RHAB21_01444 [Pseudorhizobium halotolerans]
MPLQGPAFILALAAFLVGAPLLAKHADTNRGPSYHVVAATF